MLNIAKAGKKAYYKLRRELLTTMNALSNDHLESLVSICETELQDRDVSERGIINELQHTSAVRA